MERPGSFSGGSEGIGKAVDMRLGEEGAPMTTGARRSEVPQRTDDGAGAVG
jgi:NADP-dependent 3-hydroxy acid dehydrogenase YdfG